MIKWTFDLTVIVLKRTARFFGMSYRQLNIVFWVALIPIVWAILLDRIVGFHYFTVATTCLVAGLIYPIASNKRKASQLFDRFADFLFNFSKYGMGYRTSSVIFCLIIPFCITVLLITFNL